MSNRITDERLEELLSNMPTVTDKQSKEELYRKLQVNQPRSNTAHKPARKPWLVPTFASVSLLLLLILIVPSLMTNHDGSYESMNSKSSSSDSTKESMELAKEESQGKMDVAESNDNALMEQSSNAEPPQSMLIQEVPEQVSLVHLAAVDPNMQLIIPLTLIDSTNPEVDEVYYNKMDNYIEEEFGLEEFPFQGITFDLSLDQQQVQLNIPQDYSLPPGGAVQGMFQNVLSAMFEPYGVTKINLNGKTNLGEMGNVPSLEVLDTLKNTPYKVYRYQEGTPSFFVPIYYEPHPNLQSALKSMRSEGTNFNLKAPIPEDISFEIQADQQQVTITFAHGESIPPNQSTLTMLESMLLTAKSFGYETVQFLDLPFEQLGPYDLTRSIPVPIGVNPKPLH
ncbi:hypothetical protein KO561_10535 [Radiobacillus kanasensis]|uniref:hypothetical protein n=1 Tax=Radiobacillus kanasensis TaxID=2844358 RepID=UPI001E3BDC7B|nr:hypothetical protein [Radiobacillus kanasensis]UFT97660.1 hypothetical protein KO561_10535 [Radiobacillus kanasensis]